MKIARTDGGMFKNGIKGLANDSLNCGFSYMEIAVSKLPEDEKEQDEIITYALSHGLTLNLHAPYGINNISSSDPVIKLTDALKEAKESESSD